MLTPERKTIIFLQHEIGKSQGFSIKIFQVTPCTCTSGWFWDESSKERKMRKMEFEDHTTRGLIKRTPRIDY
jgi:hypothetical protein